MNKIWTVIIILVLVIGGWYLLKGKPSTNQQAIKIGVVAPLTGNLGFLGEGLKNGILLAKDETQNTKHTYEVVFEDDQLDPKKTATAANKLISIDHVDALISLSSGTGNVAAPIAEQNKVVHFGIASDLNVAKGDYNFIHWTPPSEEIKVFVPELVKRKIKKLAVFTVNQQGEIAIRDELKQKLEGTGVSIVSDEVIAPGDKDFRSAINKAKITKPDIYLFLAFSPELEILAKQVRDAGVTTPFTGIESPELTEQTKLFEGDWYVNAASGSDHFNTAYQAKYGKAPVLGSGNGYDIFKLIVAAAEKTSDPTPTNIAHELYGVTLSGALGNLSVNSDGLVISQAVVRMIKDGKPVTVKE